MTLSSVEQLSGLAYPQILVSPRTLPAPRALLPSTPPDTNDLLISILQIMQTEISNLLSVVGNLSVVRSSSSPADTDNNTNSTGNTDDSVLAYLSADRRSDFYLCCGSIRNPVGAFMILYWFILCLQSPNQWVAGQNWNQNRDWNGTTTKLESKIEIEMERLTVKRKDASKVSKIMFKHKDASKVSKIEI